LKENRCFSHLLYDCISHKSSVFISISQKKKRSFFYQFTRFLSQTTGGAARVALLKNAAIAAVGKAGQPAMLSAPI